MEKKHKRGLFIFRRDLRLEDNLGLFALLEASEEVISVFIFDSRQTDASKNEYFGAPAFNFLLASLAELDADLQHRGSQLRVFAGNPVEIVSSLIKNDGVDAVAVNKDYTPFARTRDKDIADACEAAGVSFLRHDDVTLSPIEDIRTQEDKLYTVFTPFMRTAQEYDVPEPRKNNYENYYTGSLKTSEVALSDFSADIGDRELILQGGRDEALKILQENAYLKHYTDKRNYPAQHGTSRLSAHHKFGTISIRESYHMANNKSGATQFISELYWRDFYYYIAYHFPMVFKQSFLPWARNIAWENNTDQFEAWCAGKTGIPMVDAGMRELKHRGWMHNRSRMIVASFLTKNLLIHWQWGEQYFAQNLIDYDPAQNNGGWQWSASTGADPRPLRIFNPYTQAEKYDPDAEYIKQWVPELRDVDSEKLTNGKKYDFNEMTPDYPAPIIDQTESYHRARAVYKKAKDDWKESNGE